LRAEADGRALTASGRPTTAIAMSFAAAYPSRDHSMPPLIASPKLNEAAQTRRSGKGKERPVRLGLRPGKEGPNTRERADRDREFVRRAHEDASDFLRYELRKSPYVTAPPVFSAIRRATSALGNRSPLRHLRTALTEQPIISPISASVSPLSTM
jgi:hypothetical protein